MYINDLGSCPSVNCCRSSGGCASCCFNPPSNPFDTDECVFSDQHQIVVYSSRDFAHWTYVGIALTLTARHAGVVSSPQVLYHALNQIFIMWFEDAWTGQTGYSVATSTSAIGPFTTIADTINMSSGAGLGSFDVFVDDDGTSYHVRNGLIVEMLATNWISTSGIINMIINSDLEGPSMFKRNNTYYILAGSKCCFCKGGSNIVVYKSASGPLGNYELQGEIGRNHTNHHSYDIHSEYNYVTKAQGTFPIIRMLSCMIILLCRNSLR
jgi:beta-xylosidase